MSIKDFLQKIKLSLGNIKDGTYSQEKGFKIKDDLYIIAILILVGFASFGLGKISNYEKDKTPISILKTREAMIATVMESQTSTNSAQDTSKRTNVIVVASKSGTKYYYPWCTGVNRIKEENKVWFNSIESAKGAGLTPASGCTGLK